MNKSFLKNLFRIFLAFLILAGSASIFVTAQSDRDGDGIPDSSDSCPNRGNEGGLGVDGSGCPYYDADWDGVYDRNDQCRNRGDEYGYGIDSNGCPLTEPATDNPPAPEVTDEAPPPEATDQPEVTDEAPAPTDETPSNPPNGTQEPPVDQPDEPQATDEPFVTEDPFVTEEPDYGDRDEFRDADGFADSEDECPWRGNEGGLGTDETGCPYYDADWDGVYDRDDNCPWRGDEYGFGIDETGCPLRETVGTTPEVTEEPTETATPEVTPEITPEVTDEPTAEPLAGNITLPENGATVPGIVDVIVSVNQALPEGTTPFLTVIDPLVQGVEFVYINPEQIDETTFSFNSVILGVNSDTCDMEFEVILYLTTDEPDADKMPAGSRSDEQIDSITLTKECDAEVDSDNDGVADNLDQCSGEDDTIDTDNDDIPDCTEFAVTLVNTTTCSVSGTFDGMAYSLGVGEETYFLEPAGVINITASGSCGDGGGNINISGDIVISIILE